MNKNISDLGNFYFDFMSQVCGAGDAVDYRLIYNYLRGGDRSAAAGYHRVKEGTHLALNSAKSFQFQHGQDGLNLHALDLVIYCHGTAHSAVPAFG